MGSGSMACAGVGQVAAPETSKKFRTLEIEKEIRKEIPKQYMTTATTSKIGRLDFDEDERCSTIRMSESRLKCSKLLRSQQSPLEVLLLFFVVISSIMSSSSHPSIWHQRATKSAAR